MKNTFSLSECVAHETKRHSFIKFIGLVIIIALYFFFISVKLGTKDGIMVTILTWSFFVLSTPVADAGFLLAFPIRMFAGVRMIYTQIFA